MTTSPQDPTHRRSATRAPVGRPIKLQFDDSMDVIEGLCRNISIGGMFIVFDSSRPAGSLVRFELGLEDDTAIRGLGEVVWMRSKSEFGGPEAGFGLKFRFLEQRDRQMIFKLVSHHIKDRLANREPAQEAPADAAGASLAADVFTPPDDALPASIAIPPDPEPATGMAEPPESLTAPPTEELLPLELDPLPPLPPVQVTGPGPDPLSGPDEPAERRSKGILGDELSAPSAESDVAAFEPDLDPSIGDTPLYELGLDPEPPSARQPESELPFDLSPPPPLSSPASPPPPAEPAAEAGDEAPHGLFEDGAPPPRRREFAILPVVFVVLVAVAALAYLFKDELSARFGGGTPPATESDVATAAPPLVADAAEPAAEKVTSSPQEETPPPPEKAAAAAEEPPSTPVAAAPPPPPPRPAPSPPPPAPASAAPPPPTSSASPGGAVAAGELTRLLDVSWSPAGEGLRVILTADGSIPTGRYRYFHLAGEAPREVIKLLGVSRGFPKGQLTVDGPGVRRIRTGFHRVKGVQEQHVVLDLIGPGWKITEVQSVGSRLELTVAKN